ncbi:hypothetical protein D3C81_1536890 [compost metagenome]
MNALQQVAAACGVSEADVQLLAQLTATQIRNGLGGLEAIQAAGETMTKLCNRALKSIQDFDATNPYGPATSFAHTLHGLLTAA